MGSSGSSIAKSTAKSARKYPKTASINAREPMARQPLQSQTIETDTLTAQEQASESRNAAINADAADPHFAKSLRQLGAVQPNPTYSPSSIFDTALASKRQSGPRNSTAPVMPDPRTNPAVAVLHARQRIQEAADAEFEEVGRKGSATRQWLDIATVKQMLTLRDHKGVSHSDIESRLELRKGLVEKLGPPGVVEAT